MKRERFDTKRIWRKIMCIRQDNQQMGYPILAEALELSYEELLDG